MLHGFKKQTAPLTTEEKILVPILIDILKDKHGIDKAIISDELCQLLSPYTKIFAKPIEIGGARLRKMINYIRMNDLLIGLVASNKGYYITHKPEEIKAYISSLSGRERAIRRLRIHVERYYRTPSNHSHRQLGLF